MKENRVFRLNISDDNDTKDLDDLNDILSKGWLVQNVMPSCNGVICYVLVRETAELIFYDDNKCNVKTKDNDATVVKDYNRLKNEAEVVARQLHIAIEDMDKEYRRKYFLWRFIKEAYERSKANDNKWWANVSCYFNVSKFPEIFETYDVDDATEIIQKFYTEEDENNDKEQSSEN